MTIKHSVQGFALIGLIITIVIIGILAAIAVPFFQNSTKRVDYSEVIQATAPYKVGVEQCYQSLKTLTGCNAGANNIPSAITIPAGAVNSLTVTNGVISVIPVAQNGITADDTYILTPNVVNNALVWSSSGGGVVAGYAK